MKRTDPYYQPSVIWLIALLCGAAYLVVVPAVKAVHVHRGLAILIGALGLSELVLKLAVMRYLDAGSRHLTK
jgi:hypothetical protein